MASIKTKAEFYDLYYKGRLGNTIRQWDLADWLDLYLAEQDPLDVLGWAVRVKVPDNPYMRYELTRDECFKYALYLSGEKQIPVDKIQVSELCWDFGPTSGMPNYLTLQGEFRRSGIVHPSKHGQPFRFDAKPPIHGLFCKDFFPESEKNRMRSSMLRAKPVEGLSAWLLLKQSCDARSWDMINDLLDQYPEDTIEFACYHGPIGVLQCNTIIWEVRGY